MIPTSLGFFDGSDNKELACNAEDLDLIPGLGRSPIGEHGNSLQYSYLENSHEQRSLAGYSPWGQVGPGTAVRRDEALALVREY